MSEKIFTNKKCKYYPCHDLNDIKGKFNCLFCYCPLYYVECLGDYNEVEGKKDCCKCTIPHEGEEAWYLINEFLSNNC